MAGINDLFNHPKLRSVFLTLRIPISLALVALLVTQVRREWFLWGLLVSALGVLFQLWCFGSIKTRKELAVKGPYMFMRNPMYIARFFAIAGAVLMTGYWWAVAALVPIYWLYMVNRVKREEPRLREAFGQDYEDYCRDVRPFRPGFKRFDGRALFYFRRDCFMRNHGLVNLAGMLVFYAVCFVFAYHVNA